jgi:hypothetical protein
MAKPPIGSIIGLLPRQASLSLNLLLGELGVTSEGAESRGLFNAPLPPRAPARYPVDPIDFDATFDYQFSEMIQSISSSGPSTFLAWL